MSAMEAKAEASRREMDSIAALETLQEQGERNPLVIIRSSYFELIKLKISATFKNCVFHDNASDGLQGWTESTIHLHGEATAIHSNATNGIYAEYACKVIIHLPSHHNTSNNNGGPLP